MTTKYPHQLLKPAGAAGEVLTSNGLGAPPSYQAVGAGGGDPLQWGSEIFKHSIDFTAGASNSVTLVTPPTSVSKIQVYYDGDLQQRDQLAALVGNVLTFLEIIPTGVSSIEVYYLAGGNALPLIDRYTSPPQTIISGSQIILAHGLGATPILGGLKLVCTVAEHNYAIGDEIHLHFGVGRANNTGVSMEDSDATNLVIRYGSSANVFEYPDDTSGAAAPLTNSSWDAIFTVLT